PGPEKPLQCVLSVTPPPPAGGAFVTFDVGSSDGPACADFRKHVLDKARLLRAKAHQPTVDALALSGLSHAPAQKRLPFDRQERGLVRPVFEDGARLFRCDAFEKAGGVGADA